MGRLEGRVAIVTGAGGGIGRGIARRFAKEGATIMIAELNAEVGEQVAHDLHKEFGVQAAFTATDVTVKAQVQSMVATTADRFGAVDILINNAGGGTGLKPLEQTTEEEMVQGLNLNFWSTYWAMHAAYPYMREKGWGRIINMGSLNGVNAHMHTTPYNVGKEAMRALTRTAAVEWARYGICCNVICPGAKTAAFERFEGAWPESAAAIIHQIPDRRMGDPEQDIAGVALFLSSDDAAHVIGMTIHADGGSHINGVAWRPDGD